MDDMKDQFRRIFTVITKDAFLEKPEMILSFMRDLGFKKPIVNMVSSIINLERRRFITSLTCSDADIDKQIGTLAEECMFNKDMLKEAVLAIRAGMDSAVISETKSHPKSDTLSLINNGIPTFDDILEKPETILSFIGGLGFKKSIVNMVSSIINLERRRFITSLTCSDADVDNQVRTLAEECMFNENILRETILAIRVRMNTAALFETRSHPKPDIRRSIDNGIATFDDSMTRLLSVKKDVESFSIPEGITHIGDQAFKDCSSLKTVSMPDTVTSIGARVFEGCTSLESMVIPESVIYIGEKVFEGCIHLTDIEVPSGFDKNLLMPTTGCSTEDQVLNTIDHPEFGTCLSTSDGSAIFDEDMTTLLRVDTSVRSYRIPDDVTTIGESAFERCTSLESVVIPDSVTEIGDNAFSGCSSLRDISIPNTVTDIGESAFDGCRDLREMTVPCLVTTISPYLFDGCTSLEKVELPGNVTEIGDGAFHGCSSLKEVTIPYTVSTIGEDAFSGCTSLEEMIIPDTVTSIGQYLFDGCTSLREVVLSEMITSIGDGTFYDCSSLDDVVIPDSVTNIGADAFNGCSSLRIITIPDAIPEIDESAFEGCPCSDDLWALFDTDDDAEEEDDMDDEDDLDDIDDSDDSIDVDDENQSFKEIYHPVFGHCCSTMDGSAIFSKDQTVLLKAYPGPRSFDIPDTVQIIGEKAFDKCRQLKEVTIPYSVIKIGDYAFKDCISLEEMELPNSIGTIGKMAFGGCFSLKSITVPDSVTSIGVAAFRSCNSLEEVVLSESLMEIGKETFSDCSSLETITIPDSIREIGNLAFHNCTSLEEINAPGSIKKVEGDAFSGCTSLKMILPPASQDDHWKEAFRDCPSVEKLFERITEGEIEDSIDTVDSDEQKMGKAESSITIESSNMMDHTTSHDTKSINHPQYGQCCSSLDGSAIFSKDLTKLLKVEKSVKQFSIPDTVVEINSEAFSGCESIEIVDIPESVTAIGSNAFYDCNHLEKILIPNSVTSIGAFAFNKCRSLEEVTICGDVEEMGIGIFYDCTSLSIVTISGSVNIISESAFSNCYNLKTINLPDSINIIGPYAFQNCTSLETIDIPIQVTEIGDCGFINCKSLKVISIPYAIRTVGRQAFYNCNSLMEIVVLNPELITGKDSISIPSIRIKGPFKLDKMRSNFLQREIDSRKILTRFRSMNGMMIESMPEYEIVDDNSKTVHSPTDNRPDMNPKGQDVNKDGIKIISTDEKTKTHLIDDPQHGRCSISFDGLVRYNYDVTRIIHVDKNITSFTIPGSVTSIDNRVFSGCTSLSSIVIPDSVTSIGEYAFSYCRSLKSITIPDSVTEIGDFAFSNCTSLKEITLSASLSTIKKHTFFGCKPKTVGVPAQLNIDSIFPAETKFWIRKSGHGKK